MTMPNQIRIDQYVAIAGQTEFDYTFKILSDTELAVYDKPSGVSGNDATQIKVLNVDYTVTNVGSESGGKVIFTSGRSANHLITIDGNKPEQRVTDLSSGNTLSTQELNRDLDTEIQLLQQVHVQTFLKTPHYPKSEFIQERDLKIPKLPADYIWRMRADLQGIEAVPLSDSGGDAAALRADLASHSAGKGASMVGLFGDEDAGTVQDLAFNFANIVNVSTNGDDDIADGGFYRPFKTVQAAMNFINPVGDELWLIHIRSGAYDIGGLLLKPNVSIVADCSSILDISSPVELHSSWNGNNGICFYCDLVSTATGIFNIDFSAFTGSTGSIIFNNCQLFDTMNWISSNDNDVSISYRDGQLGNLFCKDLQPLTIDCVINGSAEFEGDTIASIWQSVDTVFAGALTITGVGATEANLISSGGRILNTPTVDGTNAEIEFGVENYKAPTLLNGGNYSLRNVADGLDANRIAQNYVPTSNDVKGHLDGIDTKIGQIDGLNFIRKIDINNDPFIDIKDLPSDMDSFMIEFRGVVPVSDANIEMFLSSDNCATIINAAGSYSWVLFYFDNAAVGKQSSTSDTKLLIADDLKNTPNRGLNGRIYLTLSRTGLFRTNFTGKINKFSSGLSQIVGHEIIGERLASENHNSCRVQANSGNLSTGQIIIYGYNH